jgi:nucleoside-diphosphate-sugar epimerase
MTGLVTGASRGIGRAIAIELSKAHEVIGTYRGPPRCRGEPSRPDRLLVNNAGITQRERRT